MRQETLTIAEADAQLAALDEKEAQLAALSAQVGAHLAELEESAGDAFLDGNEAPLREVTDLRLRADALTAALAALERRKEPARLARRRAEAADFRRQAEQKRSELAELESKTSRLLAELSRIEGVSFTASILSSQPVGLWLDVGFKPSEREYLAGYELSRDVGGKYATPRSRTLRTEIEDLEAKALAIEREINPPEPEAPSATPAALPPQDKPSAPRRRDGWYYGNE